MSSDPPADAHVTYSQEHRRCGKATCATCRDGPGHGPYWYAVWREGRRVRRRYLGTRPPPDAARGQTSAQAAVDEPLLRVETLGHFAVWCAGTRVPDAAWRRRKAGSLFRALLAAPGHALPREHVQEQLWPEAEPEAAARNLHGAAYALRRLLREAPGSIRMEGDMLRLTAREGVTWLDAAAFEAAARGAMAGNDGGACQTALNLYSGDYLPDDPYEEWALLRRESLRNQHMALLLHAAELCGARGDIAEAEQHLHNVLELDLCHEEATTRLMGLLAAAGRRIEALQAYENLAAALARDLGVAPSSDTAALRARLLAQAVSPVAAALPPQREAITRATNLPVALTSFVGREAEQGTARALLAGSRLLTLTGAGGCGKTRLALRLADALVVDYPDGVWLVELAALAAGDADQLLVARAVASVLGLREEPGSTLADDLAAFLAPRHLLLLLDNCEHLIAPCADLVAGLLERCPELRVMATSREALGVPGEVVYRLASLTVPPAGTSAAGLPFYEAATLFLERARAVRPGFTASPDTAAAIAGICIRLDGIPLAIELAAARVSVLSVEAVAARLDGSFQLLTGGPRTVLPRQRTLRATLDWSYALLEAPERALLRGLAVFTGGWALDAAEAIGVNDPPAAGDAEREVLDLLSSLVSKSLVLVEERQGLTRYRFLEPIRQYALEALETTAELAPTRDRHLRWAVALAEGAEPALWDGADQGMWLERLEAEHENCRAALRWAIAQGRVESGLRLATAMRQFWDIRGYRQEGWDWLEALLAHTPDDHHCAPIVRAMALVASANLAYGTGSYERAAARAEQGHALCAQLEYRHGIALALNVQAMIASDRDDLDHAEALYTEALALFRQLDNQRRAMGVLGNLANIAYYRRDFRLAVARYEEMIPLLGSGDGIAKSLTLSNMGSTLTELGEFDLAVAALEESLVHARQAGGGMLMANALTNLAEVALITGQFERATALARESMELCAQSGDRRSLLLCLVNVARALTGLGRHERAATLCGAVEEGVTILDLTTSSPEWDGLQLVMRAVEQQLGKERFAAAYAGGRAIRGEQLVAYALET